LDDDQLMARVAAGDEEAFRALVERWEEPLFAFLYHMVGNAEDALDLRQETLLRVVAQAGRYRPEGRFRSWLLRIGGNLARSALRRRRLVRWLSFDPQRHDRPAATAAADARLEANDLRQAVRRALDRLPDRQRQAVVLRRYQGLGQREIAQAMGVSEGAVESLLSRAAETLRRELAGKVDVK
jgi:RNA polymerase sigma-70 factor (ECF subfamily)